MIIRPTLLLAQSIPLIEWLAPALMMAGLFLLGVIAVLIARRPRMPSPPPSASHATTPLDLIDARQELQDERQRVAELIGVAQRLASKSDDKAALLNQLITQADERLAALNAAMPQGVVETKPGTTAPASTIDELDQPQDEVEVVIARQDAARHAKG